MSGEIEIRAAEPGDAEPLVDALGFRMQAVEGVHVSFGSPLARTLVATREGRVCGYLQMQVSPTSQCWEGRVSARQADDAEAGEQLLSIADREAALLGASIVRDVALEGQGGRCGGASQVRFGADGPLTERFLRCAARAANAVSAVLAAHADGSWPLDPGDKSLDLAAERAAASILGQLGLPILSEESGSIGPAPHPECPWVSLDPIDGTRNCLRGYPPWAIAIGLIDAGTPLAGLVVDLSSGRRWWSAPRLGAHVDGRIARPRRGGALVIPSTAPDALPPLPAVHGLSRVRLAGATAVDLCRVADGSAGAFLDLHRAISRPHDIAASTAVLHGAGATILDAETGQPPSFDPLDPERHYHLVAAPSQALSLQLLEAAGSMGELAKHTRAS